jgi:hypothetical protein
VSFVNFRDDLLSHASIKCIFPIENGTLEKLQSINTSLSWVISMGWIVGGGGIAIIFIAGSRIKRIGG